MAHSCCSGTIRRGHGRTNRHRLHVERLEDRWLLAVVTVDTVMDVVDAGDGLTSLREAISTTNTMPGADEITFDFDGPATILLEQGKLEITQALTITGAGPDLLSIDAQQLSRIFDITAVTGHFTLAGISLTGGKTSGGGGAVRSTTTGNLTIQNSVVSGNATTGGSDAGGGVSAVGDVAINSSTIRDNSAGFFGDGGGISAGEVTISDSQISDNSAVSGGGIRARGDVTVTSSTISDNNGSGIFSYINSTTYTSVTVTGSTISGNSTQADGGGVRASFVTVTASTISGNSAEIGGGLSAYYVTIINSEITGNSAGRFGGQGLGGGIFGGLIPGSVIVTGSTISGNSAAYGGGISGSGTVTRSTISGNSAENYGGGIIGNDVTVNSSTISGNSAGLGGGGINGHGDVVVRYSTVTGNSTENEGGGIRNSTCVSNPGCDSVTIEHSILAGNTDNGTAPDLRPSSGPLSVDFSLIGDNRGTSLTEAPVGTPDIDGNLIGGLANGIIDPLVAPLASNGGPTQTHALLPGGPAIDAGDPAATAGMAGVPDFDQRDASFPRVTDGDGNGVARIDMGAFEAPRTFVVDSLLDESDGDFSEDNLSLREAIERANAGVGSNRILFDSELFTSAQSLPLELGEIEITKELSIIGPGPDLLTIDAQELSRIFNITAETGDLTIARMSITGGKTIEDNAIGETTFHGGAIRSLTKGILTIQESDLTGNVTLGRDASGGAVFAEGSVAISQSTIGSNRTEGYLANGGGISALGDVVLTDSTVSGNSTLGNGSPGGGIFTGLGPIIAVGSNAAASRRDGSGVGSGLGLSGGVTLINSVVSGNVTNGVSSRGGGIFSYGAVLVANSTVSGNDTQGEDAPGGGIYGYYIGGDLQVISSTITANATAASSSAGGGIVGRSINLTNSILAENLAGGGSPDLVDPGGQTLSVEYSLIGDSTDTSLPEAPIGSPDANGNLIGGTVNGVIDPQLGPLADHGGPTQTHALLAGSPAIDAGDPSAVPGVGDTSEFDQRGSPFSRVYDGDGVDGPRVDMGAFELVPNQLVPGDYSQNGIVGPEDYTVFRDTFGSETDLRADGNGDLVVDELDYDYWKERFGDMLTPGASLPVSQEAAISAEPEATRIHGTSIVTETPAARDRPAVANRNRAQNAVYHDLALIELMTSLADEDDDVGLDSTLGGNQPEDLADNRQAVGFGKHFRALVST